VTGGPWVLRPQGPYVGRRAEPALVGCCAARARPCHIAGVACLPSSVPAALFYQLARDGRRKGEAKGFLPGPITGTCNFKKPAQ